MRNALLVAILLAISGCTLPWEVRDPPEAFLDPDRPPALSVFPPHVDSEVAVQIPAFTYCWDPVPEPGVENCVEAEPPFEAVQISLPAPGEVPLTWMGLAGWSFTASADDVAGGLDRTELAVALENELRVTLPENGAWNVVVEGQGPQGSATYAFRVTVGGTD